MDRGAGREGDFQEITLPLIFPGILAAAMLSFALSDRRRRDHLARVGTDDDISAVGLRRVALRSANKGRRARHAHLRRVPRDPGPDPLPSRHATEQLQRWLGQARLPEGDLLRHIAIDRAGVVVRVPSLGYGT